MRRGLLSTPGYQYLYLCAAAEASMCVQVTRVVLLLLLPPLLNSPCKKNYIPGKLSTVLAICSSCCWSVCELSSLYRTLLPLLNFININAYARICISCYRYTHRAMPVLLFQSWTTVGTRLFVCAYEKYTTTLMPRQHPGAMRREKA